MGVDKNVDYLILLSKMPVRVELQGVLPIWVVDVDSVCVNNNISLALWLANLIIAFE